MSIFAVGDYDTRGLWFHNSLILLSVSFVYSPYLSDRVKSRGQALKNFISFFLIIFPFPRVLLKPL